MQLIFLFPLLHYWCWRDHYVTVLAIHNSLSWGFGLQLILFEMWHLSRLCTGWDGNKTLQSFLTYKSGTPMHYNCSVPPLVIWSTCVIYSHHLISPSKYFMTENFIHSQNTCRRWTRHLNSSWITAISIYND